MSIGIEAASITDEKLTELTALNTKTNRKMDDFRLQLNLYLPFIVIAIITGVVLIYAIQAS